MNLKKSFKKITLGVLAGVALAGLTYPIYSYHQKCEAKRILKDPFAFDNSFQAAKFRIDVKSKLCDIIDSLTPIKTCNSHRAYSPEDYTSDLTKRLEGDDDRIKGVIEHYLQDMSTHKARILPLCIHALGPGNDTYLESVLERTSDADAKDMIIRKLQDWPYIEKILRDELSSGSKTLAYSIMEWRGEEMAERNAGLLDEAAMKHPEMLIVLRALEYTKSRNVLEHYAGLQPNWLGDHPDTLKKTAALSRMAELGQEYYAFLEQMLDSSDNRHVCITIAKKLKDLEYLGNKVRQEPDSELAFTILAYREEELKKIDERIVNDTLAKTKNKDTLTHYARMHAYDDKDKERTRIAEQRLNELE